MDRHDLEYKIQPLLSTLISTKVMTLYRHLLTNNLKLSLRKMKLFEIIQINYSKNINKDIYWV
jgi:hypothetical protein